MSYSNRLKKNQIVKFSVGKKVNNTQIKVRVIEKIGEGGQGTVYKGVNVDTGEEYAIKWAFPEQYGDLKGFYEHIKELIEEGSPSDSFMWPLYVSEKVNGTYGYIMKLIPKQYVSFSKFIMAKASFERLDVMVTAALNIVQAFKLLHDSGYSYQDLNDGNLFINPINGDVCICDTENIMGQGHYSGVLGTSRYMAPEIVRGESMPNRETDRYSIALILFLLLIGDHPLEGRKTNVPCLTNKYEKRFFGEKVLFIFDKFDKSNAPLEGIHQNAINIWPYFPEYIRDAFCRSFSQDSLMRVKGRLPEQEWIHLLMRLKSSIIKCPNCGNEMFLDHKEMSHCSVCGLNIKSPGYIKFKGRYNMDIVVPIYDDIKLYEYHIIDDMDNYTSVVAKVVTKPGKIGLVNLSNREWLVSNSDNSKTVKKVPNEIALIGLGFNIDFGNNNTAKIYKND